MISHYRQSSRAPWYSLLFALPLLIIYQILATLAPAGRGGIAVRNGADVILQSVFVWLAGAWGPRLFMLCLIGVGAWLIAKDLRANRGGGSFKRAVLGGTVVESGAPRLVRGAVHGFLTALALASP